MAEACVAPLLVATDPACGGRELREQGLRDPVEDSGVGEVVVERGGEGALEGRGLRVGGGDSLEVGDCETDAGDAGGGLSLEPVLGVQRFGGKEHRYRKEEEEF
jgi:hypothetical protein